MCLCIFYPLVLVWSPEMVSIIMSLLSVSLALFSCIIFHILFWLICILVSILPDLVSMNNKDFVLVLVAVSLCFVFAKAKKNAFA